jgi:hypothetical protein
VSWEGVDIKKDELLWEDLEEWRMLCHAMKWTK